MHAQTKAFTCNLTDKDVREDQSFTRRACLFYPKRVYYFLVVIAT